MTSPACHSTRSGRVCRMSTSSRRKSWHWLSQRLRCTSRTTKISRIGKFPWFMNLEFYTSNTCSNVSIEKQIREIEASISAKRIRIQELEEKLRTIEMERQRLEKTRMVSMTHIAQLNTIERSKFRWTHQELCTDQLD